MAAQLTELQSPPPHHEAIYLTLSEYISFHFFSTLICHYRCNYSFKVVSNSKGTRGPLHCCLAFNVLYDLDLGENTETEEQNDTHNHFALI